MKLLFLGKLREKRINRLKNDIKSLPVLKNDEKATFSYAVFEYTKQLQNRGKKKKKIEIAEMKTNLTRKLLQHNVDRLHQYSTEDLKNAQRELDYTRRMKTRIDYVRNLEND